MSPANALTIENATHPGSRFVDVNFAESVFSDVNLRKATFENVAMTGAVIRNACLGNVVIADANLEGATINGVLVTELLRVYASSQGSQAS